MAQVEDDGARSFNLHVRIERPKYERPIYEGSKIRVSSDVWPSRCVLHAYVGGEHLGWCRLPEGRDHPLRVEGWSAAFELPLQREQWGRLSVDLEVERRDVYYDEDDGVVRVFHREDPQTSSRTAVIGRARVALVDALLRDGDEDEDEDEELLSSVNATCSGVSCACPRRRASASASLSTAAASADSAWCTVYPPARIAFTPNVVLHPRYAHSGVCSGKSHQFTFGRLALCVHGRVVTSSSSSIPLFRGL